MTLTPAGWMCLGFLCQEQAEAELEFVGIVGSKGKSAGDSVSGQDPSGPYSFNLCSPHACIIPSALDQLRKMPSQW